MQGCNEDNAHKFERFGRIMAKFISFNITPLQCLRSTSLRFATKHLQIPKYHPVVFLVSSIHKQEQQGSNFIRSPINGLKIRSERKKKDEGTRKRRRPKNPNNQNNQFSGEGFAALGALKFDVLPKIESQTHHTEITEEKSGVALQRSEEKGAEGNYRNLLPKQREIKDSVEVNEVFSRVGNLDEGQKTPSLSGKDIILAMQKAYVERAKQAQKIRRGKRKFRDKVQPKVPAHVYRGAGEVRPITIKSEWLARIESLEKRLEEAKQWLA